MNEGGPTRRKFLGIVGSAAVAGVSTEAVAQGRDSAERVTLSRLEFNALHFGITPNQLQKLQAAGAEFDGDDIAINIRLYGKRLQLSSVDKVIRIMPEGANFVFTIANDKNVRTHTFNKVPQ
jgi:hypothetical protein